MVQWILEDFLNSFCGQGKWFFYIYHTLFYLELCTLFVYTVKYWPEWRGYKQIHIIQRQHTSKYVRTILRIKDLWFFPSLPKVTFYINNDTLEIF